MPIGTLFGKFRKSRRSGSYECSSSQESVNNLENGMTPSPDTQTTASTMNGNTLETPVGNGTERRTSVQEPLTDAPKTRHPSIEVEQRTNAKKSWLATDDLFDSQLLIDMREKVHNHLTTAVPDTLCVRPLRVTDYDHGYMQLLAQLTEVGDVSRAQFYKRFISMRSCENTYYIIVVEKRETKEVIGTCSLIVESKFIHAAGCRGRLEDIVVDKSCRGMKLGNILCEHGTALGTLLGCYKLSLECKDELIPFYGKTGYKKDEGNNFMVKRLDKKVEQTNGTPPHANVMVLEPTPPTPPNSEEAERQRKSPQPDTPAPQDCVAGQEHFGYTTQLKAVTFRANVSIIEESPNDDDDVEEEENTHCWS